MSDKPIYVTFVKKKLENEFESLKEGKFEDLEKGVTIPRAIDIYNLQFSDFKSEQVN